MSTKPTGRKRQECRRACAHRSAVDQCPDASVMGGRFEDAGPRERERRGGGLRLVVDVDLTFLLTRGAAGAGAGAASSATAGPGPGVASAGVGVLEPSLSAAATKLASGLKSGEFPGPGDGARVSPCVLCLKPYSDSGKGSK